MRSAMREGRRRPSVRVALGLRLPLNRAAEADLARLPGVGRVAARALVQARPFRCWDEVDAVQGVGPARLRSAAAGNRTRSLKTFLLTSCLRPPCRSPVPTATPATRWMTGWSPREGPRCSAPAAGWSSPPSTVPRRREPRGALAGALRDAAVREPRAHRRPHPDRGLRPEPSAFGIDPGLRRGSRARRGPARTGRCRGAHAGVRRGKRPSRRARRCSEPVLPRSALPARRPVAARTQVFGGPAAPGARPGSAPGHPPSRPRARRSSVDLPRPGRPSPRRRCARRSSVAPPPRPQPLLLHRRRWRAPRCSAERRPRRARRRGWTSRPSRRTCSSPAERRRLDLPGGGPEPLPLAGVGAIRPSRPDPGRAGPGAPAPAAKPAGRLDAARAGRLRGPGVRGLVPGGPGAPRCRPRCTRTVTRPSPCSGGTIRSHGTAR